MHTSANRPDDSQLQVPSSARVVVVGGANTDIIGFSERALIAGDSNPGRVLSYPGGVGRNIAENLVRLGVRVSLISVFGGDAFASELRRDCSELGIDIDSSIVAGDLPGSRYLAIDDEHHRLALAISDMRALERLTPEVLAEEPRRELLLSADIVVADANLPAATLEALALTLSAESVPLVVDPVSVAKATRLAGLLNHIAAIKPNGLEAAELIGEAVNTRQDALKAARELVARGVGRAFVTPPTGSIAWADASANGSFDTPPTSVENTIGAGDAFVAGLAYAMLAGADTEACAVFGSACSALALASRRVVNESMSREAALAMMKEMYP